MRHLTSTVIPGGRCYECDQEGVESRGPALSVDLMTGRALCDYHAGIEALKDIANGDTVLALHGEKTE